MSFYDELRKPSFRGFEFDLVSDSKSLGRDIKAHNIINKEFPEYEDRGAKKQDFTVELVIGGKEGFADAADKFEELLQKIGSGKLILPHDGESNVVVTSARRRHNPKEVGLVYFSVTFSKEGESTGRDGSSSTSFKLSQSAAQSYGAALNDFEDNFNSATPDFISSDIQGRLDEFMSDVTASLDRSGFPMSQISNQFKSGKQITDVFMDIATKLEPLRDFNIDLDIPLPEPIANAVSVIRSLTKMYDLVFINDGEIALSSSSATRIQNVKSLELLSKTAALTSAVESVQFASFGSKQEAIEVRNNLGAALSNLRMDLGAESWTQSYSSVSGMMAALSRDINVIIGRLPQTVQVNNRLVRSSLSLSHRLYGDDLSRVVNMASDIQSRNGVFHPSFVNSGDLEVLTDA